MTFAIERFNTDIERLCRRFHVRRLEVFGSAVRDDFEPATSDVDFLVEFEDTNGANLFEAYFDLRRELATLLDRPVDLVMLSAVSNPYVRRNIESERKLLYAS